MADQGGVGPKPSNAETPNAERDDWRRQLMFMRTRNDFLGAGSAAAAAQLLNRLGPKNLQAAAHNPDHSELGRRVAELALKSKGLALEPWRLRVPGFITSADLEQKGDKLFFGVGRALRQYSGWLVFAFFAAMLAVAGYAQAQNGGVMPEDPPSYFYIVGAGFMLALVVWFAATALRRKPARLLLLRKFNVQKISASLARVIANELRPYGHTVSLSDKHIKYDRWGWLGMAVLSISNPLMLAWLIIGAPVRFVWRLFDRSRMGPATVLNARDYRNLARRLAERRNLNIENALARKEAFLVKSNDTWWRMVVRLLFDSCDAIVVDLSQVSAGTAWELDQIRDDNAWARCVFIAEAPSSASAAAALAQWNAANPCWLYDAAGIMQDRAGFRAAMLTAMRATHAA